MEIQAVVVRLHPSAPVSRWGWSPWGRAPRLQRGGAGSIPAVSITASVVSREARTLRTVEAQVRLLPEALHTPVAQRMSTVLRWRETLVRLQPGVLRCCGPAQIRLSTPNRQVAGSNPARGFACPGSSVAEQFGLHTTTAAALHSSRAEAARLSHGRRCLQRCSAGGSSPQPDRIPRP